MSTNPSSKVALVTGGNRGIGYAISMQLARQGISLIIGTRDVRQGEAAAKSIAPLGDTTNTTSTTTIKTSVSALALDVTDQDSVDKLTHTIHSRFGKLDILVNNAGILLDETSLPSKTDLQIVQATLETNLIGAWRLCQSIVPLMKNNKYGRIVNVSSGAGALATIQQSLYAPAYSLSKASLNVLTIMFANELRREEGTDILVNAVDPGWVRTDMGGPNAPRSVEEGADTAVWLATLPDRSPTGGFFLDRKRIEW